MALLAGREIDPGCPWMGQCWSEGGCVTMVECPPTLRDRLVAMAALEHECELLTDGEHTDPDLQAVCRLKHRQPQPKRWAENGGGR